MKKVIFIISFLLSSLAVFADETTVIVNEDSTDDPTENPVDDPLEDPDIPFPNRHRIPPRPINCTISTETGVSIPSVNTDDIVSFRIYDESGELCFASFNDEMEFVSFLFSLEGDYVIRFVTEDKSYSGYISL